MVTPVQSAKRSAEEGLEPSPAAKRPAEDIEHKQQVPQPTEKNGAQDTAVPSTENGKVLVEHQLEVTEKKVAETNHSEVQNGEVKAASHGSDPAVLATQLATEAVAANEEAQKLVKIAAQKQAEAVEALKAATKDASADQPTAMPVDPASGMVPAAPQESVKPAPQESAKPAPQESAKPAFQEGAKPAPQESAKPAPQEVAKPAPQESAKPAGAELSNEPQAKDIAPQVPVQQTDNKISEATPPQSAQNDASVDVPPQQLNPVMATPVPTMATPTPVADNVFPPPVEKLTPANPLPQTASTPLIGNIPPQAVESLKAASQQAASMLPLQLTQELLEQQATMRTTPLTQPLDQGVAPMEE